MLIALSGLFEFWERLMSRRYVLSACALSAFMLASSAAFGQSDLASRFKDKAEAVVSKLKTACESDLKTYCSNVTVGAAHTVFCMLAHEDKISDACVDAVFDVADQIDVKMSKLVRTADACEGEVNKNCDDVRAGKGRLMQCIRDRQDKFSSECKTALKE
jgi:hypothetical protein